MKNLFSLFIIIVFPFYSFSQDSVIYMNEFDERVFCKDSASYYRSCKIEFGMYDGAVTDYYMDGKIRMTGNYSDWVKNGEFTWYFNNGSKMCTGEYAEDEFTINEGWDLNNNKTLPWRVSPPVQQQS